MKCYLQHSQLSHYIKKLAFCDIWFVLLDEIKNKNIWYIMKIIIAHYDII